MQHMVSSLEFPGVLDGNEVVRTFHNTENLLVRCSSWQIRHGSSSVRLKQTEQRWIFSFTSRIALASS